MKIATKFTAALIAGILLIHGSSAAVWVLREAKQINEDVARDEKVLARALSHAVSEIWRVSGEKAALAYLQRAGELQDHLAIRWVWLDAPRGDSQAPAIPLDTLVPLLRKDLVVVQSGEYGAAVLTYAVVGVSTMRAGAIEIADPLTVEEQYLRESVLATFVTAGLLVALSTLLAWALGTAFIGRPVALLVGHARKVGRGDLSERLPPQSKDEIGQLTEALNSMCDGLEEARLRAENEMNRRLVAVEQLRHADRLATVGTLASGVAHELGTPINVIEGHAQLIREERAASAECKENAQIIDRQCKRMARIIRDLLRFARRDEKGQGSASLRQVADETVRMLEPLARKRGVVVSVVSQGDFVASLDADHLQQVLTNILVNGIQAMPDGGTIFLRLAKERIAVPGKTDVADDYLCVRVEDSGVGMDESTRSRVFEPFFTTKDVGDGTGLGLSVAFAIIEDHGGWIDVTSKPGAGSVFAVYLLPVRPT